MLRVEVSHILPVSVAEAFAYITDMKTWPEYWPDFIRIEDPATARWSNPGDKVTVAINLLNRERALNMELKEFHKDEYEPRPGLAGLFDRLLVKRSVEKAMRRTVQNLDRVFQKRRARA
jgi:hypothetical protein